MDFAKLVEVYEELEKTASGNKIREILSDFFKKVPREDIGLVAHLTLGKIAAEYEKSVLGIAEKLVMKAVAKAGGVSEKRAREILNKKGDAGLAAAQILKTKPITLVPVGTLTIHDLFETLHKIKEMSGSGSQEKKENLLVSILQKTSGEGAKYVVRIALGTLRMGVAEMAVLDALAIAFTDEKGNKKILEKAYNICPDLSLIAQTLAEKGLGGVEKIEVHVGRPIKMMLAQRVQELEDVHKKMPGKVSVEGKYDGERVQIHKTKEGEIMLFSRRLDNTTTQFPDLVEHVTKHVEAKEFVIEGEILAIDKESGKPLPFQTLMQRRRKYDVEKYVKNIPIQLKAFDLLFVNGVSYIHEPYEKRIATLRKIVKEGEGILLADEIVTDDTKKIETFFHQMLDHGYEGIMIKNLQGEYQAGTRGWNWIKWKKEYVQDLSDTFDLVVVGAFYGRGRRSGGYGALLCACYDEKEERFVTVCKLGTGFTDEMLAGLNAKLDHHKTNGKPKNLACKKEMEPDVWFSPEVVVEALAAEVTKSPYHTAGVALRFPRFVKFRDDKNAGQATTLKEITEIA